MLLGLICSVEAQIDPVLADRLQESLTNSVISSGNNGVSAYVIMPNGITWNGSAGVGKQNIPISDTTLFHGASTTKLNVAVLMLMLNEEGLINLDQSWTNYVTLDASFDPSITIRQLLNHSSGIADYLETPSSGNNIISDFSKFYSPEDILENIVSSNPLFPPGSNFQYSNSNYVLASLIIEKVTGNPIHQELRSRIWDPLHMKHTYFGAYEMYDEPTAGVWWNFGSGVTNYSDESTTSMLSYAYGAGNIVTCPTDLGILLDALMNKELLSSESLDEMQSFVPASFNSWTAGYGLGIHHAAGSADDVILGHDGYYSNLTDMFYSTKHDFTLVTMTNTQTTWFGLFDPLYEIITDYIKTTKVEDDLSNFNLDIYPIPSQKNIRIECTNLIEEVTIIDALGKIIHHSAPLVKNMSLSINTDGIYFVIIKSGQKISRKKLVVKN